MKTLFLALIAIAISGCASGYKKLNEGGTVVGYDEQPVGKGKFRVSYQGSNEPASKIYSWFLLRSAEITKAQGAQFFKVSDGTQGTTTHLTGMGVVQLPNYSGTITILISKDADAIDAEEIIKVTTRK